jgi:hypothetical protein
MEDIVEFTEEQKRGFKDKFSVLRKRQLIATIPVVAIIAFAACRREDGRSRHR